MAIAFCRPLGNGSSGTGTLFGSPESYAQRLYRELRTVGFPVGIGAAPNAEVALIFARSGQKVLTVLSRWAIRTLGELAALPETELDNPLTLLDSLLFVLSSMLEIILRKAMDRAYALRSIRLTLHLERGEPHSLEVRPAAPIAKTSNSLLTKRTSSFTCGLQVTQWPGASCASLQGPLTVPVAVFIV